MRIIYVIGTFPKLSETFILREIQELECQGVTIDILSLERPESLSDELSTWGARTTYAPDALSLLAGGLRVRKYRNSLAHGPDSQGLTQGLKTERWIQVAAHFAEQLSGANASRVHAHFAGVPALVGAILAEMLSLPFSFSAHANDVFVTPEYIDWKTERAEFIATCNAAAHQHLLSLSTSIASKTHLLHHGIPLADYPFVEERNFIQPTILSVGRMEPKKGFDDLIRAIRILHDSGARLKLKIIGEGSQAQTLSALVAELNLNDHIEFLGPKPHSAVIEEMSRATLFALASKQTADGDRDGIPNVLFEAAAMGLPIVATDAGSISEFIEHGIHGLLAQPGDSQSIADQISAMLSDPQSSQQMRTAANKKVRSEFDVKVQVAKLAEHFRT